MNLEQERLYNARRSRLGPAGRWASIDDRNGAGYDVLVVSTLRAIRYESRSKLARVNSNALYLSRNERSVADQHPQEWRIYRVHLFAMQPRVFPTALPGRRSSSTSSGGRHETRSDR